MIERYTKPEMGVLWTLQSRFRSWLDVELALLWAQAETGQIPESAYIHISETADFSTERIVYLDEGENNPNPFHHDMVAFITACIEHLVELGQVSKKEAAFFHNNTTSYDIEDPAWVLILKKACNLIIQVLKELIKALINRAKEYKNTYMIGITHGQAAEPITLAIKLLNYVAMLERDLKRIEEALDDILIGKLSGAVGVYGQLDPEIEALTCKKLGLRPARISTQIIHRDVHAHLASTIILMVCNLEHISNGLWSMCQYPRLEAREPFGKKQKGSSKMPHKKNPIKLEGIEGLVRLVRGNLSPIFESVATRDERSIEQSSVERVAYADLFILAHYITKRLDKIVGGMEFFPERMKENIDNLLGQWASGNIKDLLLSSGITELDFDGETLSTYDWVQRCSHEAWNFQKNLTEVLSQHGIVTYIQDDQLIAQCFSLDHQLRHRNEIYKRFNI